MNSRPLEERFWEKVDQSGGPDACWPWLGAVQFGYGLISVNRRSRGAHRVSWMMVNGPAPSSLHLDHLCHTRALDSCPGGPACLHRRCVNPAHLEPVTPRENVLRGKGLAARYAARDSCKHGHPFTPDNIFPLRNNARGCVACREILNANKRALTAARRAERESA